MASGLMLASVQHNKTRELLRYTVSSLTLMLPPMLTLATIIIGGSIRDSLEVVQCITSLNLLCWCMLLQMFAQESLHLVFSSA